MTALKFMRIEPKTIQQSSISELWNKRRDLAALYHQACDDEEGSIESSGAAADSAFNALFDLDEHIMEQPTNSANDLAIKAMVARERNADGICPEFTQRLVQDVIEFGKLLS